MKSHERPGCRENNGVVISDASKSIYLFGGYNGNSWLNDLWKVRGKNANKIKGLSNHRQHLKYVNYPCPVILVLSSFFCGMENIT